MVDIRIHRMTDRYPKTWRLIVKLWRPVLEFFGPPELQRVFIGTPREAVAGAQTLAWLEGHVYWATSTRDIHILYREIDRKRRHIAAGYPTDAEIKDFYKQAALGKVSPEQQAAFEKRLKVRHG